MSRKIIAFPGWSSNPYINLLYLAPRSAGWEVATPKTTQELWASLGSTKHGDILHVHWLAPVVSSATDDEQAEKLATEFCDRVEGAIRRGVRVFWTVHNVVTHDSDRYAQEVRISQFLADSAEIIFILNECTVAVTAPHYRIPPEKTRLLLHSSYQGVYPQDATRAEARERLSLDPDRPIVGFVGQARPYKGIQTLLDAVGDLGGRLGDAMVLIAGKTPDDELPRLREAIEACGADVRWEPGFVSETDLQYWFRASDVIALPYARVLNSGSAYLSATFGIPCILPDEPQFRSLFGEQDWVSFFERHDDDPHKGALSLSDSLAASLPQRREAASSAERFARARTPFAMSLEYLSHIDRRTADES